MVASTRLCVSRYTSWGRPCLPLLIPCVLRAPALAVMGPELSGGYIIDFSKEAGINDLSIPLDAALGERLLMADPVHLKNDASFKAFFQGAGDQV